MVNSPEIVDYQVRQTPRGVDVDAIAAGDPDVEVLEQRLADALTNAGLQYPDVHVQVVDQPRRHHDTGKLHRFVPLSEAPALRVQ